MNYSLPRGGQNGRTEEERTGNNDQSRYCHVGRPRWEGRDDVRVRDGEEATPPTWRCVRLSKMKGGQLSWVSIIFSYVASYRAHRPACRLQQEREVMLTQLSLTIFRRCENVSPLRPSARRLL